MCSPRTTCSIARFCSQNNLSSCCHEVHQGFHQNVVGNVGQFPILRGWIAASICFQPLSNRFCLGFCEAFCIHVPVCFTSFYLLITSKTHTHIHKGYKYMCMFAQIYLSTHFVQFYVVNFYVGSVWRTISTATVLPTCLLPTTPTCAIKHHETKWL